MFVQENNNNFHLQTWRTRFLTVLAVHPKQKTTTFGLCYEDCFYKNNTTSYEEKSKKVILLKLALHI